MRARGAGRELRSENAVSGSDGMSVDLETETTLVTKNQKSFLALAATVIGIFAAIQSFAKLPYEMAATQSRVSELEKDAKQNRDVIVTLSAQLSAVREEIGQLRGEVKDFRKEVFSRSFGANVNGANR